MECFVPDIRLGGQREHGETRQENAGRSRRRQAGNVANIGSSRAQCVAQCVAVEHIRVKVARVKVSQSE